MNPDLIGLLRCPTTGQPLELRDPEGDAEIVGGVLCTVDGAHRYPIRGGIPRFVPESNYADNFGFQWNRFRRSQLDSQSGVPISANRFYGFTKWTPDDLAGKRVLDVGCGAGRFTEIALAAGANVVALDYSSAVDACRANHGASPRLNVVQGDIYRLPFTSGAFDFVYCLGVLQHTPDVRAAFMALPPCVAPGGRLAVDLYPKLFRNLLWPKYWLRPLTRRIPARRLFAIVERAVPLLLPISRALGRIPVFGHQLQYAIPVANYSDSLPLSDDQLREWSTLDTFDMFSPRYDQPQTAETLRSWMAEAGLVNIDVGRQGFIVGRATRPTASS